MDQIETTIKPLPKNAPLCEIYNLWEDIWVELNARLTDLGNSDAQGFAEVMMDHEVVCEDVSIAQATLFVQQIELIIKTMSQTLLCTDDKDLVSDLSYERDALQLFMRDLKEKIAAHS
ncbi:MAG: hypothetical protein AAF352_03220 [Pseudomonadota bacterium]